MQHAAPAALVRETRSSLRPPRGPMRTMGMNLLTGDELHTTLRESQTEEVPAKTFAVHPLKKKDDAPFAEMISVGRTANNDLVLADVTVSRFHLYFKQQRDGWLVCDAGSRNGSTLDGRSLQANVKEPIRSGAQLKIGNVTTWFLEGDSLYDWLAERLAVK